MVICYAVTLKHTFRSDIESGPKSLDLTLPLTILQVIGAGAK